jgi:N6-adenosine-specific RNA methylase IME4
MPLEDLCGLRLPLLAPDAWLFMWRSAQHQGEALEVAEHWGFDDYGEIVWVKTSARGWPWLKMGRLARYVHESILVCRRGRPRRRAAATAIPSVFFAPPGPDEFARPGHSSKPEEFARIVELLCPGPYGEIFAVRKRKGWACYGDAIGRHLASKK